MRRALVALAALVLARRASAEPAPFETIAEGTRSSTIERSALDPEFFPSLGTPNRIWEVRSDTTFDTNRTFTQRFELARFFCVAQPCDKSLFGVVLRASFGIDDAVSTGFYSPQGPIPAIGIRDRSSTDSHWIEFGTRVVPNYSGPQNNDPRMQSLALGATLSSGIADDAAWLPLSDFGWQLYVIFQTRTEPWPHRTYVMGGFTGGGVASIIPMSVSTWLGPQRGFIGNTFLEGFLTFPTWHLQTGFHAEASLSSIWPGNESLPVLVNGFAGWSPKNWFQMRVFVGGAGSPLASFEMQYGVRLQFFVPR